MDTIVYKANQPILSYSSDERHMNASKKKKYIYIYIILMDIMLDVICFLVLELCMQENSEFNIFFVFLFAKQRHELESNTRKDSTP